MYFVLGLILGIVAFVMAPVLSSNTLQCTFAKLLTPLIPFSINQTHQQDYCSKSFTHGYDLRLCGAECPLCLDFRCPCYGTSRIHYQIPLSWILMHRFVTWIPAEFCITPRFHAFTYHHFIYDTLFLVFKRYLPICSMAFLRDSLGSFVNLAHWCTNYAISGLVNCSINFRCPITLAYSYFFYLQYLYELFCWISQVYYSLKSSH